ALVRADPRTGCVVLPPYALRNSRSISPDNVRYLMAVLLELGRFGCHVAGFIESRRPYLPGCAAACLLLAAQIAGGFRTRQTDERVLQWSAETLLVSLACTAGYTAAKVLSDYRDHADHLEAFSRAVNEHAVAHHWRYE